MSAYLELGLHKNERFAFDRLVGEETTIALMTFWGWASGIMTLLLLGVLAPACLGFVAGAIPLARARRDWRPGQVMVVVTIAFAAAGVLALQGVRGSALPRTFWLILSIQIGLMAFVGCFLYIWVLARRRVREDGEKIAQVSTVREGVSDLRSDAVEPGPRSRLTGIEAEYYIAEWMRFLGAVESVVTPARRDGGVDVRSAAFVAQVKHRPGDIISVMEVRELVGVAGLEGRAPLFFTSGRYSRDTYELASRAGVALFIFRPQEGRLIAANALANRFRQTGLNGPAIAAPEGRMHQVPDSARK